MLNKVSACSGVTSWSITRIYLGPTTLICHTLDICHTGGLWDALALFRRSRSGARKICVYARVCRVCIQSSKRRGVVYRWPGVVRARFAIESVFAEFDPRALSSSSSPRIFKEGKGGTLAKMWKFDPAEQSVDDAKNPLLWHRGRSIFEPKSGAHYSIQTCAVHGLMFFIQVYAKCLFVQSKVSP